MPTRDSTQTDPPLELVVVPPRARPPGRLAREPRLPLAHRRPRDSCASERPAPRRASAQSQQGVDELGGGGEVDVVAARVARACAVKLAKCSDRHVRVSRATARDRPSGVLDPHLADVDVARCAQRTRASPACAAARLGLAGARLEPAQARQRHRQLGGLSGLGREPDRLGVVGLGPRPRRGRRLIARDVEQHCRQRPDARAAAHLVDERAQPRATRGVAQDTAERASSHDSRRGSWSRSGSVSRSGTAARMSSAPPRPARILAMPVAIRPSARARGSVTAAVKDCEPVGQRGCRAGIAEVVGRVHGVSQRDGLRRPRTAARARPP